MPSYAYLCLVALLLLSDAIASDSGESDESESSEDSSEESVNNTAQDLYVIKSVVYEIGILTDAGNDTDLNETHERVDISIFEPNLNGSVVDLNIPFPIQTNVSGIQVTGLIPSNLGFLFLPPNSTTDNLNGTSFPIFPNKQIKVSRNISTVSKDEGASILSGLPKILGLDRLGIGNESQKSDKES